jgi:hypothetical protein
MKAVFLYEIFEQTDLSEHDLYTFLEVWDAWTNLRAGLDRKGIAALVDNSTDGDAYSDEHYRIIRAIYDYVYDNEIDYIIDEVSPQP